LAYFTDCTDFQLSYVIVLDCLSLSLFLTGQLCNVQLTLVRPFCEVHEVRAADKCQEANVQGGDKFLTVTVHDASYEKASMHLCKINGTYCK